MRKTKWTDEELSLYVAESFGFSDLLRKLKLSVSSGNYKTIRRRIESLCLDTRHWTGKSQCGDRNPSFRHRIPLEQILVENGFYRNLPRLKQRLIKEGLLENKCAICGLSSVWNNKKIVMILDHVNGESFDHRFENLRLVCPNCNSQIDTFAGRNKKKKRTDAASGCCGQTPNLTS